jgi:excisionase family DNA binding protein
MSKRDGDNRSQAPAYRLAHSISDVTNITGVGRSFIYEEIGAGRLVAKKAGRRTLIFDADLNAWLASLPVTRSASSKIKPKTP